MGTLSFPNDDLFVNEDDFVDGKNVSLALQRAYGVLRALRRSEIDWYLRRKEIELAFKVVCDAVGGSPSYAFQTVMLVQPDLRRAEDWEANGPLGRALTRACDLTIMAEVAHRCKRYRQAVVLAESALGVLQAAGSQRGDEASLTKTVASSKRNGVAAAVNAVVSIWMPALRRATYPPQVMEHYHARLEPFISASLASGQVYGRSDAFGSQGLFFEVERLRGLEEIEESQLQRVADLREVANATWSNSKRAQATAPLVEMEYLRLRGDLAGAREQAAIAGKRMIDFGLPRHLERMTEYRYLSF
jgi:hypothetical protein